MIKLKKNAIKTMADSLAKTDRQIEADEPQITVSSEEITYLNRKLREAFNILPNSKNAPAPFAATAAISPSAAPQAQAVKSQTPPMATGDVLVPAENNKQPVPQAAPQQKLSISDERKKLDEQRKAKDAAERQQKEDIKRAEEEKKRKEDAILDQKKRAEEEKWRERERLVAQEKLRQEKLRAEAEEEKKRQEEAKKQELIKRAEEEKRRQLAILEAEREKERQRRAEEERKIQEEIKRQEDIKRAEEEKIREQERLVAQEKLHQEKLRAEAEEEKKRQEEARIAQELKREAEKALAKTLSGSLNILAEKLRSQKTNYEKQLTEFPALKAPLEQKKKELEAKIAQIKAGDLVIAEQNENDIEAQVTAEKAKLNNKLSIQEEKEVEQKVWAIEDRRKEAEQKRWAIEDEINKIGGEIKKVDSDIDDKDTEEKLLKLKIKNTFEREKLVVFALDKGRMEQEMLVSVGERDAILPAMENATNKKNLVAAKLQELSDNEKAAKDKLSATEERERQTADPVEKRAVEQERWQINETLKSAIKSKWDAKESLKEAETQMQSLQTKIDDINKKINLSQNTISDNETALEKEGIRVNNIRDIIAESFKENNIEINPDLLNDIIQPDDLKQAAAKENQATIESKPQTEAPKTKAPDANPAPVEPRPAPAAVNKSDATEDATPAAFSAAVKVASVPPASVVVPAPAVQGQNVKQEAPIQAKPADIKTAVPQGVVQANIGRTVNGNQVAAGKPLETATKVAPPASIKNTETAAQQAQNIQKEAAAQAKPADIKIDAKTGRPVMDAKTPEWAPETMINDIMSKQTSIYVEQVEGQPAKNIRTFAPEKNTGNPADPMAPAEESVGDAKEDADKKSPEPAKKIENDLDSSAPAANLWENRWDQIKKNTTPTAATAAASPNTVISANNDIPQQSQDYIAERPNEKNKTMVRVMIVLILVGILGVAIVLILTKNNSSSESTTKKPDQTETKNPPDDKSNPVEDKKEDPKKPILTTISTKTIPTEDLANIPNLVFPSLQTSLGGDGYHQIVILNKKDNTTVGLRQFLSVFKIKAPSGVYSSVSDDFTLFIYSSKGKNRIGFVSKVEDSGSLETAMAGWEASMAQDTNDFYKFLGRKTQSSAVTLKFSPDVTSSNIKYRSLIFAPANDNFSASWAIYNGKYLVFATSNEALVKIFDQLPK